MNYEYWLDIIEEFKSYHHIDQWLLLYFLNNEDQINKVNKATFPDIRFWAITLLCINAGIKIYDDKNGLWDIAGCMLEIEELWEKRMKTN